MESLIIVTYSTVFMFLTTHSTAKCDIGATRLLRFAAICFLYLLVAVVVVCPRSANSESATETVPTSGNLASRLEKLVVDKRSVPSSSFAVSVREIAKHDPVFSYHANQALPPASVLKVITSTAALKILGPEYQFTTEILVQQSPGEDGDVGNLIVRGHGDPALNLEHMWKLAGEIANYGVKKVEHVVVDQTLFESPQGPTGLDPYKAGASAVSFNYNCLAVTVAPSGVVRMIPSSGYRLVDSTVRGSKGKREEAILELQESTPEGLVYNTAGLIRISGFTARSKPETVFRTVESPAVHFGFGLRDALVAAGVSVNGGIVVRRAPSDAKKLFNYQSIELAEILKFLNRYSSNFSANQVLFALGEDRDGRFSMARGISKEHEFLGSIGIASDSIEIHDGSGLDKRNRLTADVLSRVLQWAYSDLTVGPFLLSSLSRFGNSGTLRKRELRGASKSVQIGSAIFDGTQGVLGKTGTLDGVSSLVGYAPTRDGRVVAFAVLSQGVPSKDKAMAFEDKLVETILDSTVSSK